MVIQPSSKAWTPRLLVLILLVFCCSFPASISASTVIIENPQLYINVRDFALTLYPKSNGQLPSDLVPFQIVPNLISELTYAGNPNTPSLVFNDATHIPVSFLSSNLQTLSDGTVYHRVQIMTTQPTNPAIVGCTYTQTIEIFSHMTTAMLFGSNVAQTVSPGVVYYTVSIDMNQWNLTAGTTQFGMSSSFILSYSGSLNTIHQSNQASTVTYSANLTELSLALVEPLYFTVDGQVNTSSTRTPYWQVVGSTLQYTTIQKFPIPTINASVTWAISILPGSVIDFTSPTTPTSTLGYVQAAIAVGIIIGIIALSTIIAFTTYFFCLESWLPIWAYISRPARAGYERVMLLRRPPGPTFEGEDGEELEEDDDYDMDGLQMERVDPEELLRIASGAVGGAASSRGGSDSHTSATMLEELRRLRKAMGRRLSNFVGWDGPPPGSATDRSPSPKEKRTKQGKGKKKKTEAASSSGGYRGSQIVTPEDLPNLVDLEASSGGVVSSQMFSQRVNVEESGSRLLADREESPLRSAPSSGDDGPSGYDSATRHDSPARSRPSSGEYSDNDSARPKKSPGLRHFKIISTANSSMTDLPTISSRTAPDGRAESSRSTADTTPQPTTPQTPLSPALTHGSSTPSESSNPASPLMPHATHGTPEVPDDWEPDLNV